MPQNAILTKLENQILTVTINRPEKNNSLDIEGMYEFAEVFRRVNADDSIRCIVVTGTGDYFCTGADISAGTKGFELNRFEELLKGTLDTAAVNTLSPGSQIVLSIRNCYKPVIAAINGPAAGVGATLILPMDYRFMADTAKIGYVFTRRGVVPEAGSTWLLPRIVGTTKASDWLLSGRLVEATEAKESGLVNEICSAENLLPQAYALANDLISTTSAVSVACTKQLLMRMSANAEIEDATALESLCFIEMVQGPEAREGMQSFIEKRPPHFPGRVSQDLPRMLQWWDQSKIQNQ